MKKGIYIIIVGLIAITLSISYSSLNYRENNSTPDSGWDYDYDGGGGGSSWDSGSSYDYGHDYHYGGGSSSSTPTPTILNVFIVLFVVFFIFGVILYFVIHADESYTTKLKGNPLYEGPLYNFIREKAYLVYQDVQYAWSNFDYDKLRKLLSDELYNNYVALLEQLKVKNQQNIMSDIELLDIVIMDIKEHDNEVQYNIRMVVRQKDYVIDKTNNSVVRGTSSIKHVVKYDLTYLLSNDKENTCPNCGSKLDSVASQVCPSCGSTVVSDKHDMIIIKKENIR